MIPAFLGETRFAMLAYSMLYRWTPERRELDYLRMLGASNQSAKEVKIFGLGATSGRPVAQIYSIDFTRKTRRSPSSAPSPDRC